jgi:hypothetical protein
VKPNNTIGCTTKLNFSVLENDLYNITPYSQSYCSQPPRKISHSLSFYEVSSESLRNKLVKKIKNEIKSLGGAFSYCVKQNLGIPEETPFKEGLKDISTYKKIAYLVAEGACLLGAIITGRNVHHVYSENSLMISYKGEVPEEANFLLGKTGLPEESRDLLAVIIYRPLNIWDYLSISVPFDLTALAIGIGVHYYKQHKTRKKMQEALQK